MLGFYNDKKVCPVDVINKKFDHLYPSTSLEDCSSKPKLRTYVTFKDTFKIESYVKMFLNRQERSLLAQLRFGILPLPTETGRYQNIQDEVTHKYRKPKPNERVCQICKCNLVKDEIHFVCICNMYSSERLVLFNSAIQNCKQFLQLSNPEKFIYLMNNETKNRCKYIIKAWYVRREQLYK